MEEIRRMNVSENLQKSFGCLLIPIHQGIEMLEAISTELEVVECS